MNRLDQALALAAKGFHVFPVEQDSKLPAIKDFPNRATRDKDQIRKWFAGVDRNIGISTTRFGDDKSVVVVDIDNKNGKDGDAEILRLELDGYELPETFEQATPSGGRHLIYIADRPLRQGVNVLGDGLDIRAQGGFVVGPGSQIAGKHYRQINGHGYPVPAPEWLVHRLGESRNVEPRASVVLDGVDSSRAADRALAYLKTAPVSVEGEGGDLIAYKVAAKLKDLGCREDQALDLLLTHWNDQCSPPWPYRELQDKVTHAYRYGKEPVGSSAPEAVFEKAEVPDDEDVQAHPIDALSKEFAFIKDGAFVLQETTDEEGQFTTVRLSPNDMHAWFANKTMAVGDKQVALSKLWMQRKTRREYDKVVFSPLPLKGKRFYNLWRGFSLEPAATGDHATVAAFKEHALKNVCNGDEALCKWLIGFFAHMIQKPWEKPLVALVFKGKRGTGKNALLERVGHLLGNHFMVADDDRYLLGNFNSHFEANLFFVLDEASWAGDKRAEGKLKGVITGSKHNIERKGAEPYKVRNLSRVAIISNEDWVVPAGVDERRFAVFTVGDGRRQDRRFFESMRKGMEQGGYAHLLRFLMDYDLTGIDVNAAPSTSGLIEQKHQSLNPVDEWWLDCLSENKLVGDTFDGDMPDRLPTKRVHQAFLAWAKQRNIKSRLPKDRDFSANMKKRLGDYARARVDGDLTYAYSNPGINVLRSEWETFIGGAVEWGNT